MLGKKVEDLKARDIPKVLINVLLIELTPEEIEKFHNIRNIRNNIAHGQPVNLNIKLVAEYNEVLMGVAKKSK
ncbi:hypothetical protein [Acinetobacter sp. 5862]|uniref:hypothetical protein n=1 Tax=Acinetobacter sp. 5862 TaxID=2967169 RepID=UPI002112D442|nr:hypothetical protein [Acinetobacter sp. 5862]